MKIVCCYTNLHPDTKASLPSDTHYYNVSSSVQDYFGIFNMQWGKKETFINVEHDLVVQPDQLQELWDCEKPWCLIPYHSPGWKDLVYGALGIAKFDKSLMERFPSLIRDTEKDEWPVTQDGLMFPHRHYRILDVRILRQMHFHGIAYHAHMLPVLHPRQMIY